MSIAGAFIVPHPPILLPEVGKGEERKIQKTADAYRSIVERIASLAPETIVVTSPHSVMYADYFHISPGEHTQGDLRKFGVSGLQIEADYDTAFVASLTKISQEKGLPAGTFGEKEKALDHGTLIPLYFLNKEFSSYKLVRIGLSGLPPAEHYRLGQCIAETALRLDRRVVLIASGDLSHKLLEEGPYGFAPEGPEFDRQATEAMAQGDFLRFLTFPEALCDAAAECGLRSFQILAGSLDGMSVQSELLSYEGPFGVGYGAAAFLPGGPDSSRCFLSRYLERERRRLEEVKAAEDAYVRLARMGLETYISTGCRASLPEGLPYELSGRRAGVFVSLKKNGRLRGCIGTIGPVTGSVAEEILRNAVSAGCEDPRFDPVTANELDQLCYSVDVLGEAEPIVALTDLDPARYGVIVTNGHRRGLLLPNLEGVDSVERQITIAKQKAGIGPEESCSLERFEVVRHK